VLRRRKKLPVHPTKNCNNNNNNNTIINIYIKPETSELKTA
jgi:hypothetical protein